MTTFEAVENHLHHLLTQSPVRNEIKALLRHLLALRVHTCGSDAARRQRHDSGGLGAQNTTVVEGFQVEIVDGGVLIDGRHGRGPLRHRAYEQRAVGDAVGRGLWEDANAELVTVLDAGKAVEEDVVVYVD